MLLVGVWFVKRIKNTDDYYVAGRTLGPVVLAATVCATIIGGSAMMGRAGIAYTTASWPLPPPCPICWACLSSPATPGVFSRWGRSTTSSPSPACSSTASESRLNASWLLWWLSPWWARWPPRSPPPLPLLSCWGDRWASATRWGLLSPPPSSSSIPPPPDCSAWCTPMWCSFSCSLSLST